tara:strand:+ start:807 stop:1361 length:555 start_codon:yes stop_codon:yes gene_type:complete
MTQKPFGAPMSLRHFFAAMPVLCLLSFATVSFAEDVEVNFNYTQDPQVDFSKAPKGPLKIAGFTDARGGDATLIGSYNAEQPVAIIVHDALSQAFIAGGAGLVEEGQSLTLNGEVTEFSVQDKAGEFDVTVRAHVTLHSGSRTAYDTVIFGRASAAELNAAIHGALEKLITSLIWDDYFLNEVI